MIKFKFFNNLALNGNLFLCSLNVFHCLIAAICWKVRDIIIFLVWGIEIIWERVKVYHHVHKGFLAGHVFVWAVGTWNKSIFVCRIFSWAFRIFVIIIVVVLHNICKKFKLGEGAETLILSRGLSIFSHLLTVKLMMFLRDNHFMDIFSLDFTGKIGCVHCEKAFLFSLVSIIN